MTPFVPASLVPEVLALAEDDSDWSPVVLEVPLLRDWSPVVADVLLLRDWSPVLVLLSIVTLERPRRSMVGLTVDVEPVCDVVESAELPVIDEVLFAVDPLSEGDELAVAPEGDAVPEALPLPVRPDSVVVVLLEPSRVPPLAAVVSSMQSMCTGLLERSFARPVSLSASLPAFGWSSSLHSGLEMPDVVVAVVSPLPERVVVPAVPLRSVLVEPAEVAPSVEVLLAEVLPLADEVPVIEVLPPLADMLPLAEVLPSAVVLPCIDVLPLCSVAVDCFDVVSVSVPVVDWAKAGAAPSIAATARVLRNWERIIE